MSKPVEIHGTVAPGFESVKALYEHKMQTLEERDTQLCVYYKGEQVVDLWASAKQDPAFGPDAIVNIFSSGKSLEAIALAWLADQGLLDYGAPVASYWPEFSAHGKDALTVADIMRHEGGMAAFDTALHPADLLTDNIKQNRVGKVIEAQTPKFRTDDSKREYHAVTRGWIANEIFRRIEPRGRTIGEFLREDIAGPLEIQTISGVQEQDLDRRIPVTPLGFGFQFVESLKPRFLGRRIEKNIFQIIARIIQLLPAVRRSTTRGTPPPFEGMNSIGYFNEPDIARGETPSANTHANARSLARLAAVMADRGQWLGRTVLSEQTWENLHGNAVRADMGFATTTFTRGGVALFPPSGPDTRPLERALNEGREGFYGWMGLGGSIFQWHPEARIGFGYVPTSLNVLDLLNERGKDYQAEVLRCVARLES